METTFAINRDQRRLHRWVETTIAVNRANLLQANIFDLIKEVSLKDRELRIVGEVGAKIRVLDFISPNVQVSYFFY